MLPWILSAVVGQALICIDPGHGGRDPGAVGCGQQEKQIVLDTSLQLQARLQTAGFRVVMTRDSDVEVGLTARADYANSQGADRFVSIHANSAASVATGIETFCHTSGGVSLDLRDRIQEEMIATWPLRNRGGKTANFSVLRNTSMPAALTELGFINNCSVDVTYLASQTERGRAADAHVRALQRHLGNQPPPTDGRLLGVAFEDLGNGTEDTSQRLPDAVATVNGMTSNADENGLWSFTVPTGSYTVSLSAPGYKTANQVCEVTAGIDNWCSFGLVTEGAEPDAGIDAGILDEGIMDAGQIADAGAEDTGPIEVDSGPAGPGLPPLGEYDSGIPDTGSESGGDVGGGCSCDAAETTGWAFAWLLLLPLVWRRRRLFALTLLLWPTAVKAESPQVVGQGIAPVISPDGRKVAFTQPKLRILQVFDGKTTTTVREGRGVGLAPLWLDEDTLIVRAPKDPFRAPAQTISLTGKESLAYTFDVTQADDRIYLTERLEDRSEGRLANKAISSPRLAEQGQGRCYAPTRAAGFVSFACLETGLWLYRISDGQLFALGRGGAPHISADGRYLVFERTEDDGHQVTASGLFVVDLENPGVPRRLLDGPGFERHGSLSLPDAEGIRTLAYEDRGQIYLVRLNPESP